MLGSHPAARADTASRPGRRAVVACSAAVVLGGAVYLNALHNPFVYDDYHTVVANASIQHVADLRAIVLGALTRPIVNFSYAIDQAFWGARPLGFHVTNVVLHMFNVILLWQLARRFERGELTAFAAAALFAVHPMMTEAVGYISGRSEVLCATFFLLALLSGRRWVHGDGARWAVATIGLWIAALATKETAAMFPFVFFAYDWLAVSGSAVERHRRIRTIHLPLVATAAVAGVARLLVLARVEYPGQVTLHWSYLLIDLDVARRYLGLMFYPSGQTIFHEVARVNGLLEPRALMPAAVVGLMLAVAARLRHLEWPVSFGILWFLLLLVPSSALIALDQGEPMAEHRIYLAGCGVFVATGAAIGWLSGRLSPSLRAFGAAGLALVLLALGAETMVRNAVWSDPVALWRESVDLAPGHYRPRLLLGEALEDAGRRDEALEQYRTAIRLRPTDPTGYVKVGRSLAELGQWSEARQDFLKAIEIDPHNVSAHRSLATLDAIESRVGSDAGRR